MIKIFFTITQAFNPNAGGVQKTTFKLGKYFTEQGMDVYYYSFANNGHIDVLYGKLFHGKTPGSCNPENILNMKDCITLIKPDIVINQMPYEVPLRNALADLKEDIGFTLIGCLRNSLYSVKNNIAEFIDNVVPPSISPLFKNKIGHQAMLYMHKKKHAAQLRDILDKHDYYILLAPPNKDELNYFIGNYQSDKVYSIPNSIPEVLENIGNKDKVLLYVGRLEPLQKRVNLLLPVWEKIQHRLPDWKFVIVGDGEYGETMKDDIQKGSIQRVELHGFQKPEEYYKRASVFIMTSAYEGFPNVILEAQSYGVVPVAFNSYAVLPWIVNDDKDTLLCAPYDINEMAEKILRIAGNEILLKQMQENSLANASKFTIDKVGETWLRFFQEIGRYTPVEEKI